MEIVVFESESIFDKNNRPTISYVRANKAEILLDSLYKLGKRMYGEDCFFDDNDTTRANLIIFSETGNTLRFYPLKISLELETASGILKDF